MRASLVLPFLLFFTLFPVAGLAGDASDATKKANQAVREYLPFEDQTDFENAQRGFIATLESGRITGEGGVTVYDMKQYEFLEKGEPATVNPSLWRQSRLNAMDGLFKVADGIYQVRAFDLANISFIRGKKGWIVVDPLTANETAKAAYDLLQKHVEKAPVTAVIYTHSHLDHFAGVKGLISNEQVESGEVMLIGPEHFFIESVNENLMAGNQMGRRASYMYGNVLPKSPEGTVGSGLGVTTAAGTVTIIEPTTDIVKTPQRLNVDGVEMVFMNTPGAEAPAELMFYMPGKKAFCQAEEINHTFHNLYTLRGAQVRNGLKWSKYIHESIEMFGDEVQVSFGSHHWPTWGNQEIVDYWKKQRDLYRYVHDEVLRLANHGYTLLEVGEMVELPDSLGKSFASRGYYGSVNHNAKAQYQLYFGFFTGNPADLHPLPPETAGKKFVDYVGGAAAVIEKARTDYERGEYRWAATALNYVVFADPDNKTAKDLLAQTYEQMGYQAESGPWRNFYLSGAKELRDGVVKTATPNTGSPDIVRNLGLETYLDYLAVRLNHPKAAAHDMTFNVSLPDVGEKFVLSVENGAMNYTLGKHTEKADATVTLDRAVLDEINLGETTFDQAVSDGKAKVEGNSAKFGEFLALLDRFEFWFNIVTP
ncbi:MAG: MBL fold metallo-hydrolase [Deltaproteobacteria bacterium]|nr:MBL fold metallo-hydrolase [Deltaproteobacteria bacterium]MBW2362512.1 MBL fold metallo-hydrolase [Deltaproteobacteria bacterium]